MTTQPLELRRVFSNGCVGIRLTRSRPRCVDGRVVGAGISDNRGTLSNYGINATGRLVTPRACARVAPIRPARYASR
jgi:hypothetical protein